jgi:ATP-dependent Lon protease
MDDELIYSNSEGEDDSDYQPGSEEDDENAGDEEDDGEEDDEEDDEEEDDDEDGEEEEEEDDHPPSRRNAPPLVFMSGGGAAPFLQALFAASRKRTRSEDSTASEPRHKNPKLSHYDKYEKSYYQKLDTVIQKQVGELETTLQHINREEVPLRFKILLSEMDSQVKAIALQKVEFLRGMSPSSGEYHKMTNWVEALCRIPIGILKGVPLLQQRGELSDHTKVRPFLAQTKSLMDNAVYGHQETKDQMIRFLAQWIVNPKSKGSVIGIHGKPGVGKTTLVKEGICKALDMPFAFIPLGGANDGSYLEGHSYTYEGSTWGKIVDVIMKCGCMNPILYFDELDKVSTTRKGEEIINTLIHLTDPGQNDHFGDKYFNDVAIDLSKAIIIFTYNDDSIINPILKDRITRITANDYTLQDKIHISQKHLIPSLQSQLSFTPTEVVIPEDTIKTIIQLIEDEAGVRNLRRALELVFSTLNLHRLLGDELEKVEFPFTVTEDYAKKLLKKHKVTKSSREDTLPMGLYL